MKIDFGLIEEIINRHSDKKGHLIQILQEVQEEFGYIPEETIEFIAEKTGVFPVDIYGIITFYAQLYLKPRGKYPIMVCQGTACHVKGSGELLKEFENKLGIKRGETTPDGKYSIEAVACLGCCSLAPVVKVGDKIYSKVKVKDIEKILAEN